MGSPQALKWAPCSMKGYGTLKRRLGRGAGGGHIPHTLEGDGCHYTAFLLATPSLQAANCSMQPNVRWARAVLCISHLTMAMGRLLGQFVEREAEMILATLLRPSAPTF